MYNSIQYYMITGGITMSIRIVTDSCADIPKPYAKELNVEVISLTFNLNGKDYFDDFGQSMAAPEFYRTVREGAMPTTALVNTQRYIEFFSSFLDKGEDVIYIAFSSALSGSYQCAVIAANELKEKYKDNKVAVIDSKCASMGITCLVHYAVNKLKENPTFEELHHYIEDIKLNICHQFTVDDLNHLRRGGRLSGATAVIGTLLSIKPVLHVDIEGRLVPVDKVRGRKKSLTELVNTMEKTVENPDGQTVFISHGDCIEDAEKVAAMIKERIPGIKDVMINYIGPIIGTHSGPGTVALFYYGGPR